MTITAILIAYAAVVFIGLAILGGNREQKGNQMPYTEENDIEYCYNNEPICPYCDEELGDAWELEKDEGEIDCGSCGRVFRYTRDIEIRYSTEPVKQNKNEHPASI